MSCRGPKGMSSIDKLNQLLREAGFDEFVERLCEPYYHDTHGPARHSAGRLLPDAVGGLLRGPRLAAGHRLAVCRQPQLARIPRHPARRRDARPFQPDAGPRPTAAFGSSASILLRAASGRRQGPVERQDGGRRRHDAGGQRGDEEHRPARHGRGLAGVRPASDARSRPDRSRATNPPPRSLLASTASGRTRRSRTKNGRAKPTPTAGSPR